MNENFDIIFLFAPILLIVSFIFTIIFSHKRTNDDIGEKLDRAKRIVESAGAGIGNAQKSVERIEEGIGNAQESTERIESTNRRIEQSIAESQRIIEEIKKQRIEE